MTVPARPYRTALAVTAALLVVLLAAGIMPGATPLPPSIAVAEAPGVKSAPATGALALPVGASVALATGTRSAATLGPGWTTLMSEGFEGTYPAANWVIWPDPSTYSWGKRDCQAHSGSYSALGHGGGSSGSLEACGTDYPANLNDWLIYGPFSLEDATAAEWSFWYNLDTESEADWLSYWVSVDENNFYGNSLTGPTNNAWESVTMDLANVPGLGSVLGQSQVWVAFAVDSDASVSGKGAYVDDVTLRARGAGATVYLPIVLGGRPPEQASQAVSSDQSAVIATTSGVSVSVPQGAVSLTADGQPGTMTFSVEESPSATALPAGYQALGSAYTFGPSGFNFSAPVKVAFPLPPGADIAAAGIMTYDEASGQWLPVPATTDTAGRIVSTETQHFTMFLAVQSELNRDLGKFNWTTLRGPGGDSVLGTWICLASATLSSGASTATYSWPQWSRSVPMATDAPFESSLPKGQYTFYYRWGGATTATARYAQTGPVDITSSVPFHVVLTVPPNDSGAILQGFPPCLGALGGGVPDPSAGTGEVQVTLNWTSTVDLDLHVTEPSGEEIYYLHRYSGSNGQLDLDNQCGDFVLGRPENVFWPAAGSGGAPSGHYLIRVAWYSTCSGAVTEVPFSVRVVIRGRVFTFRKLFTGVPNPNSYMTVAQCEKWPVGSPQDPICW